MRRKVYRQCSLVTPDGHNPCSVSVLIIEPPDPAPAFRYRIPGGIAGASFFRRTHCFAKPGGRLFRGARQWAGFVGEPGEQTGYGDVFVERLPVQTAAGYSALLGLLATDAQQWPGLVGEPGEQAAYGDVFVERLAVQTEAGYSTLLALFPASAEQPREPGERHPDYASVDQRYPEIVVIEADAYRSSSLSDWSLADPEMERRVALGQAVAAG
jgi:hypothetical protein